MKFIENQEWRYATKEFDPNRKITAEQLEHLKKAIQLSVSSYGLQLYKVLIIENKEVREKLRPASWNQSQITDASHLFVFCNYTRVSEQNIDSYVELIAATRELEKENLKGYGDFMKAKIDEKSIDDQFQWTKHQTYIALANLLAACAEIKIDTCPMEGFEAATYNEVLGLTERGLNASVIVPVGYRSDTDTTQSLAKVRKPMAQLFEML
ncbi:NAD(P)H-dependent oxidoreductase [Zhouia amylolytica]|uniref:NAD(P)H-dependent oxidoreductase n=1 Tax=Zhouia amylolytica TaxID=376730 RepID=UPI0020CE45FF|nr:NAD(P)H-dependent oxidoreductase [Zhouia amylolytica]MCQ0110684.1 NAD(P)H-dependent oxidoreductase [Zhouia amylolytica]